MRYRIVNRFRFISFLVICLLILSLILLPLFNISLASSRKEQTYIEVEVNPGDTLWQIAKNFGPDDKDIREVIYDICRLNNITADTLKAGSVLLIPTK